MRRPSSPASLAMLDVDRATPQHVRPIKPRQKFCLEVPHASAWNPWVEREAWRHLPAVSEFSENDLAQAHGQWARPIAIVGFGRSAALHGGEEVCNDDGCLQPHGRRCLGVRCRGRIPSEKTFG